MLVRQVSPEVSRVDVRTFERTDTIPGTMPGSRGAESTAMDAYLPAIAELRTPDGVFPIQERRSRPRLAQDQASPDRDRVSLAVAVSPQMMGLGGLIIIGVLVGSFTARYGTTIGHVGGPLSIPSVGFLALQLFLARAAFRLYEEIRSFTRISDFIISRMLRYLPATIPAVLIGFVLLKTFGLPGFHVDAAILPANLLLVADMVGVPEVDGAHWRLKIEILQAVLVAMAWFGPTRGHVAALLTGALVVTAVYVDGEPARSHLLTLRGLMTIDGYLPCFAFGIALCELVRNRSSLLWQAMLLASGFLAFRSNDIVHGTFVLGALAVLSAIAFGKLEVLGRWNWLNHLGAIAFPIYVVHNIAGFIIIGRLERYGFSPMAAILIASAVVIAAGEMLNRFIERPLQKHGAAAISALASSVKRVTLHATFEGLGLPAVQRLRPSGEGDVSTSAAVV